MYKILKCYENHLREYCWCSFQSKRNQNLLKWTPLNWKFHLMEVLLCDFNMTISWETIYEGGNLFSTHILQNLIYERHMKRVMKKYIVKLCQIHTCINISCLILLYDHQTPLQVLLCHPSTLKISLTFYLYIGFSQYGLYHTSLAIYFKGIFISPSLLIMPFNFEKMLRKKS